MSNDMRIADVHMNIVQLITMTNDVCCTYSYNVPLKYILSICNLRYHCIICLYHQICMLTNLILVCAVLLDDAMLCP